MNISQPTLILAGIVSIALVIIIIIIIIILRMMHRLNSSFAKLGYVTREDAKKYFGDAADKVTDMNSTFYQQNQEMIDSGVRKVLEESGQVMAGSIAQAQQQAGNVILKAQEDARQIIASTKTEAQQYYTKALGESVDAMEWALEQYMKDNLNIKQHEDIITRLLETYINERKS